MTDTPSGAQPQVKKDPAAMAAESMLRAALKTANLDTEPLPHGSALIVKVVAPRWVEPVFDAATRILPDDNGRGWSLLLSQPYQNQWHNNPDNQDPVDLLLSGRRVACVVYDAGRLPSTLRRVADHTIRVIEPTWTMVRSVAESVGFTTQAKLSDEDFRDIEPSDLTLALRAGAENDVWLTRLLAYSGKSDRLKKPLATNPIDRLADRMIAKAFELEPGLEADIKRPATVTIVEVPSDGWSELLGAALSRVLSDEQDSAEQPDYDDIDDVEQATGEFLWVIRFELDKLYRTDETNRKVLKAIEEGVPVIGVAASTAMLPVNLVDAADRRIRISSPDWPMVRDALLPEGFAGDALTDAECRVLSGENFKLAIRPHDSPSRWIERLRAIAERDMPMSDGPTLDDLHGMGEAVKWGKDLARDLKQYAAGKLSWANVDRGCLVWGPPGSGKTSFAKALARSCGMPLIIGSQSAWQGHKEGHLGHYMAAMKSTFNKALAAAPAILFLDELDGIGSRDQFSDRNSDYWTPIVNAVLEFLDGAAGRDGLVVIGASNHPSKLDPALTRSGRLDRSIYIGLPDIEGLEGILRFHLGADLSGVNLMPYARRAQGMTGADIERLVRGTRRRARTAERGVIPDDLLAELGGGSAATDRLLRRRAYHEAAHAVAYTLLLPGTVVRAHVHRKDGVAGSVEVRLPSIMTADEAVAIIRGTLAGRVGEELMCGSASSGAGGDRGSDLAEATKLATCYLTTYGLEPGSLLWLGKDGYDDMLMTLRTDAALRQKVGTFLSEHYLFVRDLLARFRSAIEAIAAVLIEESAISGDQIVAIITSSGADTEEPL